MSKIRQKLIKNSRIYPKCGSQKPQSSGNSTTLHLPGNRPKKPGVGISFHKLLLILYSAEILGFLKIKENIILSGIQSPQKCVHLRPLSVLTLQIHGHLTTTIPLKSPRYTGSPKCCTFLSLACNDNMQKKVGFFG